MGRWIICFIAVCALSSVRPSVLRAEWRVTDGHDQCESLPDRITSFVRTTKPGDDWPADSRFRWMENEIEIPATIEGQPTSGKAVGLRFTCGDGGAIYVNGELRSRYDNDHPALVLLTSSASPRDTYRVTVQVYGRVQGGDHFDEARLVVLDGTGIEKPVTLTVDAENSQGIVPDGLAGLSQGGGLADYTDATARVLKEGGFRWFRMDNILTPVVRATDDGELSYQWDDFDRRVDFIRDKLGADIIFAVSYMPEALDAIDNKDRQSAPRCYLLWEDLCYRAARRCVERNKRVRFWEVWNEANSGWLKPGLHDKGRPLFAEIYKQAVGQSEVDEDVVRRFEAYCKLYRATARGVLRADPQAKIGGPALASGPFEGKDYDFCRHGKGFAKGLMLWCRAQKLPLDFVSWHEYFHPAELIAKEANAFRQYLAEVPGASDSVESFMLTEWNEAWWPDRPQDHELGAAYCADCIVRAFIPAGIDRPCFFYVKQSDMNFRGDWSLLMGDNVPKATYNALKVFNGLSGKWVKFDGTTDHVTGVAAWDAEKGRLSVVLVNFKYRYAFQQKVQLTIEHLPDALTNGSWSEWTIDRTHSNVWHDRNKAQLEKTGSGAIRSSRFVYENTLPANSIVLLQMDRQSKKK